jgi:hypothetical protein
MSARTLRSFGAGLALAVAAACGGDSSTGPESIAGSYSLQTVNGKGLPYALLDTVEQGVAFKIEVVSPTTLTLGASADFRLVLTTRTSFGGITEIQSDTISGTYARAGTALTLASPGQEVITATWDQGDSVTLSGGGDVLVFRR